MNLDKFREKGYSNITSLISAIFFFIIGSIIFTNPNGTIKLIAYVLGSGFTIIGTFKTIVFYIRKKKEKETHFKDLCIGITAFVAGIILLVFSGTVEVLIRIIMGAWILFNGVHLLINSIKGVKSKANSSKILIILSSIMILGGIYMILSTNLVFQMIGLCIMVYSVVEIIGYIYYSQNN
ncbi:MAG: DUF308 domain-containing protein [Bacilli bacterium]|nr:DUF308 domain-containing protein [Bacilli bacterium]